MKHSNELFQLIHGLVKTEKGYVIKYLSAFKESETNAIKMFRIIADQKLHDDLQLKKKLTGIKSEGAFNVTKNYLFKNILKALEKYHQSNNIDVKIRSRLNQATLLLEKSRNQPADRKLNGAKLLAYEYELHIYVLEAIQLQKNASLKMLDFVKDDVLIDEEKKVLKLIGQTKQFQDLAEEMMKKFFSGGRDESQKVEMKKIISNELFSDYEYAATFLAKKNYLTTYVFYYYSINSADESYEYSKKRLELFYSYPFTLTYYTRDYLASLNNVLYTGYLLRKMEELNYFITKVKEAEKIAIHQKDIATIFYFNYHVINYYNAVGDFKSSSVLCEELTVRYEEMSKFLNANEKLVMQLHMAYSYFGNGQFRKSMFRLNEISRSGKLEHNPDAQAFFIVFYLINHYELENHELVYQMINSNNKNLQKLNRLNDFQIHLLSLLSNLTKPGKRRKDETLLLEFKKKIEESTLQITISGVFEYFDYTGWFDSKLQKRQFSDVVKEKKNKWK